MSVLCCGSILAVGMVSMEYGGASTRWSNELSTYNNLCLVLALYEKCLAVDPRTI